MQHILKTYLIAIAILSLPAAVLAQPWRGISIALPFYSYTSSGEFTGSPTTDFFEVTDIPPQETYLTKGTATGLELGYQFIYENSLSLYLFLESISGKPNRTSINHENKKPELPNLQYNLQSFGTELRFWSREFFFASGPVLVSETYASKNATSEFKSKTQTEKPSYEIGLLTAIGYEHPKSKLAIRFSVRLIPSIKTAQRNGTTSMSGLSIGYRFNTLP